MTDNRSNVELRVIASNRMTGCSPARGGPAVRAARRVAGSDRLTALRGSTWMPITLRGWIRRGRLSGRRVQPSGRDRRTMSHCAMRFGCVGAVRRFAASGRLTARRDSTWMQTTRRGWIWAGGLCGLRGRPSGRDVRRAFYFAMPFGNVAAQ